MGYMANGVQDRLVYVYNQTRETFVATEAAVANNYFLRLIGLLGKTARWAQPGRGLWIIPCRGVHTLGMMFPIDLVFLNKEKQVIHIEEYVRPFRISKVFRKAASVLELPVHTIYRSGTREGDCLEIALLRNERRENNRRRVEFQIKRDLSEASNPATGGGREQESRDRTA